VHTPLRAVRIPGIRSGPLLVAAAGSSARGSSTQDLAPDSL